MRRGRLTCAIAVAAAVVGVDGFQDPPSHVIENGEITARVYVPDAKAGFYRSTRFDWSGAIASLQYKGHDHYGPWFTRITDIYECFQASFTGFAGDRRASRHSHREHQGWRGGSALPAIDRCRASATGRSGR